MKGVILETNYSALDHALFSFLLVAAEITVFQSRIFHSSWVFLLYSFFSAVIRRSVTISGYLVYCMVYFREVLSYPQHMR